LNQEVITVAHFGGVAAKRQGEGGGNEFDNHRIWRKVIVGEQIFLNRERNERIRFHYASAAVNEFWAS